MIGEQPMTNTKMSKQEKQWQAEGDARILGQADDIRKDLKRLKAALAEMERMNKIREAELKKRKQLVEENKKNLKKK